MLSQLEYQHVNGTGPARPSCNANCLNQSLDKRISLPFNALLKRPSQVPA